MIKIYDGTDLEWNKIVKQFDLCDIYFLREYSVSYNINSPELNKLVYFEYEGTKIVLPFIETIKEDGTFKWATTYGYGGPLSNMGTNNVDRFKKELLEVKSNKNISEIFIKFCPFINNHSIFKKDFNVKYIKDTITINLEADIMRNMDSKNRNMVRKAIKNDVIIEFKDKIDINTFKPIYDYTMKRQDANDFYYFSEDYYKYLNNNLADNVFLANAIYQNEVVASVIIFKYGKTLHYHLSGATETGRKLAATNLILYRVSEWGKENGYTQFYLGGGKGKEDSLFKFKYKFNKNGRCKFCICNL